MRSLRAEVNWKDEARLRRPGYLGMARERCVRRSRDREMANLSTLSNCMEGCGELWGDDVGARGDDEDDDDEDGGGNDFVGRSRRRRQRGTDEARGDGEEAGGDEEFAEDGRSIGTDRSWRKERRRRLGCLSPLPPASLLLLLPLRPLLLPPPLFFSSYPPPAFPSSTSLNPLLIFSLYSLSVSLRLHRLHILPPFDPIVLSHLGCSALAVAS